MARRRVVIHNFPTDEPKVVSAESKYTGFGPIACAADTTDGFEYRSPEDGFEELQFYSMEPAFPIKSAICVIAFLILGIACISGSALITFGMVDSILIDRSGPLFICGLLMFIPGAYFTLLMLRTCLNHGNIADVLPKF